MNQLAPAYEGSDRQDQHASWYWGKPPQQPVAPAAKAAGKQDHLFWAALVAIFLTCAHFTMTDYGARPVPSATLAHLVSDHHSRSMQQLSIHSTVSAIDLKAGLLELELTVQHPTYSSYCNSVSNTHHVVVVGSTSHGAAQASIPLCESVAFGQPVKAVLPLIKQAGPQPFDEHTVEIRMSLQPNTNGPTCVSAIGLELEWSASWAVQDLQVAIQRKVSKQASLIAAASAGVFGGFLESWESSMMDELGSAIMAHRQTEVVYSVKLTRSSWLRIIHLSAAMMQLVAIGWCSMLLVSHLLCLYLMQRFWCSRAHGLLT